MSFYLDRILVFLFVLICNIKTLQEPLKFIVKLIAGSIKIDWLQSGIIEGAFLKLENGLIIFNPEMIVRNGGELLSNFILWTDVSGVFLNSGLLPDAGFELIFLNDLLMDIFSHINPLVFCLL